MADLAKLKQQHDDYNARLQAKGITLLSYRAPCCGAALWSRAANAGERWDTLATCPECGGLYIKVSTDKAIAAMSTDDQPQLMMMNPATGSVDTRDNWAAEGYSEMDGLIEVVANHPALPGYDPARGAWRPA